MAILNSRVVTVDGLTKRQLLIQWSGLSMEESSWEDITVLQEIFPHFNLEDQVYFDGGGNVTEAETEMGMSTEAVAEKITEEGSTNEEPNIGRIRRKPGWLKESHL